MDHAGWGDLDRPADRERVVSASLDGHRLRESGDDRPPESRDAHSGRRRHSFWLPLRAVRAHLVYDLTSAPVKTWRYPGGRDARYAEIAITSSSDRLATTGFMTAM